MGAAGARRPTGHALVLVFAVALSVNPEAGASHGGWPGAGNGLSGHWRQVRASEPRWCVRCSVGVGATTTIIGVSLEKVRASYDAVAARYADEVEDELVGKPLDRALLGCFAELVTGGDGPSAGASVVPGGDRLVADVGCGFGHVTAYLAELGVSMLGVDLAPAMIDQARRRYPRIRFAVGSMLALPAADNAWAGAICAYSIIHLTAAQRRVAFAELGRVVEPGGWLLVGFHVSDGERISGGVLHIDRWWDHQVDLDFSFLAPEVVADELTDGGWSVQTRVVREPYSGVEHQSRRAYLLAQRPQAPSQRQ